MLIQAFFSDDDVFNQFGECDFLINYNDDQSCKCHFEIVAAASTTIRNLSKNGEHPSQITIHSQNKLNHFEEAIHFFYGSQLKINSDNVAELVQISYILKSHTLIREVLPPYIFFQKKQSIEHELQNIQDQNMIKPSSIQFIAQFFQWIITDVNFISHIPEYTLGQIISHRDFKIESEDYLIEKLIEVKAPVSAFLHVRYEFVTPKGYKKIFEYFNPMNDKIFAALKQQFLYTSKCDPSENPRKISPNSFKELIYEYVSPKKSDIIPSFS